MPAPDLATCWSEDRGILFDEVRDESPDSAAIADSELDDADGWTYWALALNHKPIATLQDLRLRYWARFLAFFGGSPNGQLVASRA